jgi:hypothetical protein
MKLVYIGDEFNGEVLDEYQVRAIREVVHAVRSVRSKS